MSLDNDINTKKRKLQDDEKPRKKRKHKRPTRDDDADLDVEAGLNRAFARMDGQLLADHLAQKTRRFGTELSSVELNDLYISGEYTILSHGNPMIHSRGKERTLADNPAPGILPFLEGGGQNGSFI